MLPELTYQARGIEYRRATSEQLVWILRRPIGYGNLYYSRFGKLAAAGVLFARLFGFMRAPR